MMMTINLTRRGFASLSLATFALATASLLAPRAKAAGKADVKIDNFAFAPETLTIASGTTVTWTNRDDIPHSIVESNGLFHSQAFDTNGSYSYTFEKAGTYDYICGLHPHMMGKIIVKS
jgi:plastocyanin